MAGRILRPWPAIGLIRRLFTKGARDTVAEMQRHAVDAPLVEHPDVPYGAGGAVGTGAAGPTLSVFAPRGTESSDIDDLSDTSALPTVVWIHGGAWISGVKEDVDPYLRLLAQRGLTAVSLDYSISPEVTYPTALAELNAALGFLSLNAETFAVDARRFILAGDSAGANLVTQLAALTTDPDYATQVGIEPALAAEQLRAVILHCGIFDVSEIPEAPGLGGWGFRRALRAYLGQKEWASTAGAGQMSTLNHVSAAFPPTFISAGNGDPLTASQSRPFAERLRALGVPVTERFYPDDHVPALPHEYQFHLDFADARVALDTTVEFVREHAGLAT
ncbi:alpha/beta hydrolase [Subtercola endophyticus]|uniref:alpha/beta hydrolase n=1 Tax=Subtercola endophyticus TaxID=2895559 RepID=UPI001E3A8400|nr:alpha/beta hydrolase [Subtercola endophyticus]UFS59698.1 alpha/beta hydrolase [Subtercola endophyticus]